jgi:protein SCO1/2
MKIAVVALMLLASMVIHAADGKLKAGVFEPPRVAPDFSLDGSDGRALTLSRYRGKVVILGFGFSHCAYVCPITLSTLARLRKKLGAGGQDVQVVYVTVDPERDSPERLRTYLEGFDPAFIGATGTAGQLERIRQAYGVTAVKKTMGASAADYYIDHSSFLYLIDREGSLRALMPYGHSADDFAHDVAILLKR